MSESLFAIPDPVLLVLQESVNRFLALDPEGAERLSTMQGQVLLIEVLGLETRLFVVPGRRSLQLFSAYDAEPDCTVRGTPVALLRLALGQRREEQLFSGDIEIIGDNHSAQRLSDVFKHLDVDWEELLAQVVGDHLAHQISSQARTGGHWLQRSAERLTHEVRNYLYDDGQLLATHYELQRFLNDVDHYRDAVERLAVRIEHLTPRILGISTL
ncbi:SCP2 sterol-binding domain-containing protein [Rhodoferax sp. 4810]|uniref:Ubiquinone biosynthesis accessory factor UbiJ n=1 Tax=Thiospirillum jenense TaxID=1653858 RepID=A0A839H6Y0_9GAMM|nr:SCP2 sterol-binding domain-containing protein [Thiospirillum jenense]MBB1074701.1 SCP2 sterol-binding domain-containing protein [Rhodoferax jenense]MBB1125455.1 SCP2 sterol-binding domain-containing protein [Thiospirillum jenense]